MKPHAIRVGLVFLVFYALCLVWRITMTDPAVMNFHLLSLKTFFPGFQGYDVISVVWGAILSFGYGFFGSLAFHTMHNGCCLPKKETKKVEDNKSVNKNYLLLAGIFVAGLVFGVILTGINASSASSYYRDSASMMKNNGSSMMQTGQMMMGAGGMMSDRGQRYGDTEMMQRGQELMQNGEELRGNGTGMMERGNSMMQMMGR